MASELQLVTITDEDGDDTADPASAPRWTDALELLAQLESRWSRFLPDSDVSRLNLAGGNPVHVDPVTITLVSTMIEAWRATERRFDPTILPALIAVGYPASIDDPRRVTILPSGAMHVDGLDRREATLDHTEVDPEASTVRLAPGLFIDAGGIGKGLAADLTVASALRAGATGAMTGIGGDIAMGGRPPEGGWVVHIEHPHAGRGNVATITVTGGGVATSSIRSRRWWHEGAEQHHVIDPWSSAPSTTDLSSVTVVARSGWLAEAHATAALLAGSAGAIDYAGRHDLSALAVANDGRILATADLEVDLDTDVDEQVAAIGAPR
jgi:thiamine biosynthesis lipoprotein